MSIREVFAHLLLSIAMATEASVSSVAWTAATTLVTAVTTVVDGWFLDEFKGRKLDGTLRCYQCDTTDNKTEAASLSAGLCSLQNWKHANVTEKRAMIMQCPRRKSAFCHLVVREGDPSYAVRGCHGPRYEHNGAEAHTGCFYMDKDPPYRRACLCDELLCNGHPPSRPLHTSTLLLMLTTGAQLTLGLLFIHY